MKSIKTVLNHVPYGVASIVAVIGLIFVVPGGLLILGAICLATWGDKLTSFTWRDR